jgi:hypothetical protein
LWVHAIGVVAANVIGKGFYHGKNIRLNIA